jgi:hypothetical protein
VIAAATVVVTVNWVAGLIVGGVIGLCVGSYVRGYLEVMIPVWRKRHGR